VAKWARNDSQGLLAITTQSMRFLGLISALIAGLLCGFSESLMRLWLGPRFGEQSALLWFLLIPVIAEAAQYPLSNILIAGNHIKQMAIVTLLPGIGSLVIAVFVEKTFHLGPFGVAGVIGSMQLVRNLICMPIVTGRIMGESWLPFIRIVATSVGVALAIGGVGRLAGALYQPHNLFQLAVYGSAVGLLLLPVLYFLALGGDERATLQKIAGQFAGFFRPAANDPAVS